MPVSRINWLNILKPTVGFGAEYQAVYDSWTTKPSGAVAAQQNLRVKTLVDANVWAKKDVDYVFAAHTNDNGEALTNWFNPGTFDATLVNAPAFVAFEGFTGNGTTSYIRTNWNLSTNGINYTRNSAYLAVYIRTNVAAVQIDIGANEGGNDCRICSRTNGDIHLSRINEASVDLDVAVTDSRGYQIITRTGASARALYKNAVSVDSDALASNGVVSRELYIKCRNNAGTPGLFSTRQTALASAGGGLTAPNVTAMTNADEVYMDSNGKGVIP